MTLSDSAPRLIEFSLLVVAAPVCGAKKLPFFL